MAQNARLAGGAGAPGGAGGVYCSQAFSRATAAARSDETAFESHLGAVSLFRKRCIRVGRQVQSQAAFKVSPPSLVITER